MEYEHTYAAEVEFSSSMNPLGSGARATGMGGAFIAVADDATAASWNPAGLIHLEKPEVSIVYSYFNRDQSYNSSTHPEMSHTKNEMDVHDINFASVAYPFVLLDRNLIVTFNYQRLYDMSKNVSFNYNYPPGIVGSVKGRYNMKQEGYIGALSPAIAIQILPELYFGATVNIWDDFANTSSWKNTSKFSGQFSSPFLNFGIDTAETNKYKFSALNANLGLIYTLSGKYSFGFVYKTAYDADVTREKNFMATYNHAGLPPDTQVDPTKIDKFKYSMPASYGLGFAYRHSDSLSFALDVYRTEWSDFAITDQATGIKINPVSNKPIAEGKPKDTTQIRLGGEYLFIGDKTVIPVRAGLFYDPEPGISKINDYFGFSVGSGIAINSWAFDFSYQYRFGNRVSSDIIMPTDADQRGINMDTTQHTVMTSLIYHF
jgi:long-subunit fatty acid transport protein